MNTWRKQFFLATTIISFYTAIILSSENPPLSEYDFLQDTTAVSTTPSESGLNQEEVDVSTSRPTNIQPFDRPSGKCLVPEHKIYLGKKPNKKIKRSRNKYIDTYSNKRIVEK